ncbi:unnamed protein product, partial [marine sediment metagenome]
FLPSNLSASVSANQQGSKQKLRTGKLKRNYTMKASKNFSMTYSPIRTVSMSLNRSSQHDLHDIKDPMKIFSALFSDTTMLANSQNFNATYKPTRLQWLSPSITYKADYALARSPQLKASGNSVRSGRSIRTTFSFSPQKLVNTVYTPPFREAGKRPQERMSPGRRPPGVQKEEKEHEEEKPGEETEQTEEKKAGRPLNPLYYVEKFSSKFSPVSIIFDKSTTLNTPGLDGTPTLKYQLGVTTDPG